MKKLILMAALLVGCEQEQWSINACGTQCRESGNAMKSYSREKGCECVVPEAAGSAKAEQ
jgi:hypothetical protein